MPAAVVEFPVFRPAAQAAQVALAVVVTA
jgi:hypothetical protein